MQLNEIIEKLKQNQVVAYPTEAVFGLGCNPRSESAVMKLLALKQRPIEKGLILVAPDLHYLLPYIDESKMGEVQWQRLQSPSEQVITWVVPANADVPAFLTGQFNSIAVRLCRTPAVKALCDGAGFALTSTSANLTNLPPCRDADAVRAQFGADFPVLDERVDGRTNPSTICDIFNQHIFRQG